MRYSVVFCCGGKKIPACGWWPTEGNNVSMLAENTLKAARGIIFLLSEDGFLKAVRGKTSLLAGDNKRPRQTE